MDIKKTIGENVSRIRKQKKITQNEVALALKMSRASVVNLESGRQAVSFKKLMILTFLFDVELTELVGNIRIKAEDYFTEKEVELLREVGEDVLRTAVIKRFHQNLKIQN